jgi:hypothetical protein
MSDAPRSDEAETSLLGHLIGAPEKLEHVPDELRPFHFFGGDHQWVYTAILAVAARGELPTKASVELELKKYDRLRQVGGRIKDVLREATGSGTPKQIQSWAATILETAAQRDLLKVTEILSAEVRNGRRTATEAIERLRSFLDGAPTRHTERATHPIISGWTTVAERGDVYGTKPLPRKWLLKRNAVGVLPLSKLGILAAAGGVGKTMAVVELALAIASGKPWLGREGYEVPEQGRGRVLLALGEEDQEEVDRRMHDAAHSMGLSAEEARKAFALIVTLPLAGTRVALTRSASDDEGETDAARALRAKMADHDDWRLVVFDPLSRFAGPDAEKDNASATLFIETAESFCKLGGGPTVLVVHHSAQHARGDQNEVTDASQAARGATGLTDGARWVASMSSRKVDFDDAELRLHLGRHAALSIVKNNYAPPEDGEILLRRDRDHGGALHAMDDADRKVIAEARTKLRSANRMPTPPPTSKRATYKG